MSSVTFRERPDEDSGSDGTVPLRCAIYAQSPSSKGATEDFMDQVRRARPKTCGVARLSDGRQDTPMTEEDAPWASSS